MNKFVLCIYSRQGLNVLLNAPCSSPVNAVKLTDHLGHMSLLLNDAPVRIVRRSVH